jgi:hypothetical protein
MIGTWYLARQPEVAAMSMEVPAGAGQRPDSVQIAESEGWSAPGVRVMVTGIVLLLAGIVLLALGVSLGPNAAGPIALIWIAALLLVVGYLALRRLQEEDVVELDEERKAAMVSNLLVVLCSEQATQQVVNTGSLYQ